MCSNSMWTIFIGQPFSLHFVFLHSFQSECTYAHKSKFKFIANNNARSERIQDKKTYFFVLFSLTNVDLFCSTKSYKLRLFLSYFVCRVKCGPIIYYCKKKIHRLIIPILFYWRKSMILNISKAHWSPQNRKKRGTNRLIVAYARKIDSKIR